MLKNRKTVCKNMLTNPLEEFERTRFLYYSKGLGMISMNHALFFQLTEADWERVRAQMKAEIETQKAMFYLQQQENQNQETE